VGRVHPLEALRLAVGAAAGDRRCSKARLPRGALIGQEHVQEEIYRALSNFVREGRPNRLVLLHGPNGSAKSTIVAVHDGGARELLDARRGRALPLQLGLPVAEDDPRLARLRQRQGERRAAADSYAHLPTTRSTPSSSSRCATTRSSSFPSPSARRSRAPATSASAGKQGEASRASQRVDPARAALAQEPAGLRGAPLERTTGRTPRCSSTCRSSATSSRSATAWAR
jgi:hypothetical protein